MAPKKSLRDVQVLLGRRIRVLRSVRGLHQEAIEAKGLNYKYYQRIETGRCNLTLSTLQKIASALEVKIEDLFQFPLGLSQQSPDAQEVVGLVMAMIADRDEESLEKLRIFILEILDRKP